MSTDLISTWADTGPAWLGGIGGILAALVSAYALYRAIRSETRHVEWQITNEPGPGAQRSETYRLVNTTSGIAARIEAFENVSAGLQDSLRGEVKLPAVIAPQAWFPFNHSRSLASPYPTTIRVTWREGLPDRRFRRRRYSSTYYVD